MSKKCSYLSKPISRNFNSWLQDRINGASHKRCLHSHGTAASGNDRPSYFYSSISLASKRSKERDSEPLHTRRQPQSFPLRCVCWKSVSLQKKKTPRPTPSPLQKLGRKPNRAAVPSEMNTLAVDCIILLAASLASVPRSPSMEQGWGCSREGCRDRAEGPEVQPPKRTSSAAPQHSLSRWFNFLKLVSFLKTKPLSSLLTQEGYLLKVAAINRLQCIMWTLSQDTTVLILVTA